MTAVTQPSGLVTLVFSDVEGSTRLLAELGAERYREVLGEYRRVVREACAAQQGYEVDSEGDAFLYAFASAQQAVAAVREALAALAGGPVRIRVGVHTGEPLVDPPKYVGLDVHRASRVMSAAHGGQVVLSAETVALLDPGSVELVALGSHRLKDFDEPVSLFQLGEGSFPPLRTLANTNLPTPVSSFVGRQDELQEADRLLRATRLLTVTGPGGAGKTRFAVELAHRVREERFGDYPDGVFACFFSTLRDPSLVLATIAHTLSIPEQPGRDALETLTNQLERKHLLLLLDNLEHLLQAAPDLSRLLQGCPGLTLLCTGRETLRLQGETTYPLPPLADDQAVTLVCDRARVEPSGPIRALCARLEGLPLALELAAARLTLLSPQQLLDRLSQRLDLLKAGRDADPRQQTLRATIQWSHELLTPHEQQLFARLSVFQGGCTLQAAETICDAPLDTLHSLLDKNLLRHTNNRYWMLETIREYAEELLEAHRDAERLRQRRAEWFTKLLERYEPELEGAAQDVWFDRLEAENDNIRAALRWAIDAGAVDLALRLAGSSGPFWWVRGYWTEGRRWLGEVLDASVGQSTSTRCKALERAMSLAVRQDDFAEARRIADECLAIVDELEDPGRRARAWGALAVFAGSEGDVGRFRDYVEKSAAYAREAGDSWALTHALNNLGFIALAEGQLEQASAHLEEALELAVARGDQHSEALVLGNLGFAKLMRGIDSAGADFAASLRVAFRLRFLEVAAGDLLGLAAIAADRGSPVDAARLLGGAGRIHSAIGANWDAIEAPIHARATEAIERELGHAAFAVASHEGHALDFEELVELATKTTLQTSAG